MVYPQCSFCDTSEKEELDARVKIDRIFQIVAAILTAIAAYFFWMENKDGVFVSLVLAASSFFLSIRFQAKARLDDAGKKDIE